MKAPLGIGLLGAAHGHAARYLAVLRTMPQVRLTRVYDADPARAEAMAAPVDLPAVKHLEDLLDDPETQAVIVASETAFHAEHCQAAAAAGKAILCQKPMALTLAECDGIIAAIEKSGIPFAMAFQMRSDPANQTMREMVRSGAIGKVFMARRKHCIDALLRPDFCHGPTRWHLDPALNRGMWADDASHAADWLHWMFGPPTSVVAEIGNFLDTPTPEDNGAAIFQFAERMLGVLINSSTAWAGENTTEILGSRGVIIQNYGDGPSSKLPPCPEGPAVKWMQPGDAAWRPMAIPRPAQHGDRIAAAAIAWAGALIDDRPPLAGALDGRIALDMVLASYESAETGQRVFLESATDKDAISR